MRSGVSAARPALPLNTMDRNNNWGNWGLVLVLACARYLDDDELLDRGEQRWKEFLDRQIDDQGHLHHEVHRSGGMRGIWYSHFSLFPQTIAAEILRLAGRDLYDWRSPMATRFAKRSSRWRGGPAIRHRFRTGMVIQASLLGVTYFSYFEILNAHWPNEDAAVLLRMHGP